MPFITILIIIILIIKGVMRQALCLENLDILCLAHCIHLLSLPAMLCPERLTPKTAPQAPLPAGFLLIEPIRSTSQCLQNRGERGGWGISWLSVP